MGEIKGLCVCLGENLERQREGERESAQKMLQNVQFFFFNNLEGLGYLYWFCDPSAYGGPSISSSP